MVGGPGEKYWGSASVVASLPCRCLYNAAAVPPPSNHVRSWRSWPISWNSDWQYMQPFPVPNQPFSKNLQLHDHLLCIIGAPSRALCAAPQAARARPPKMYIPYTTMLGHGREAFAVLYRSHLKPDPTNASRLFIMHPNILCT